MGPFFAFCGIANPLRFQDSLKTMAIQQTGFLALPDHVRYDQKSILEICNQAIASGARYLVTTQKDIVKIKNLHCPLPRYFVEISLAPEADFELFISNAIKSSILCLNKPNIL